MKRWMALFTIAMWVVALATPVTVDAAGGCSPNIANSSNKTVSGTSGAINPKMADGDGTNAPNLLPLLAA